MLRDEAEAEEQLGGDDLFYVGSNFESAHIPRVTAFNHVYNCFILLFTRLSSYSYLVIITICKHKCPRETVIIASVLGGNLCCLDLTTLVQWDYPHILDISNSSVDDLDARHDVCEVRLLYVDYSWLFTYGTDRIGYLNHFSTTLLG